MSKHVLLLSLATGGYHWQYKKNIESHRRYALKNDFKYSVVDHPRLVPVGLEVVWLKLYLIREALKSGYEWVVFVDADAYIQPHASSIVEESVAGKYIYMAKGWSGRYNSGVMMYKNHPSSLDFLNCVIGSMGMDLPEEDEVGWGENGHVIHFAKNNSSVFELDTRWNNNYLPNLNDNIRHFSAGPLRPLYKPGLLNMLFFRAYHYIEAIYRRFPTCLLASSAQKKGFFEQLTLETIARYPSITLNSGIKKD